MDTSNLRDLRWSYWATIIYIFGMLGYVMMDASMYIYRSFDDQFSHFVYAFLAILFVIDAGLYIIDWYLYAVELRPDKNQPIKYHAELIACFFQNLGSYCYLVTALFAYNKNAFMEKILLLNLIGSASFLMESGCLFFGWRATLRRNPSVDPERGCVPQDIYMWALLVYVLANLVYLCSTTLAYRLYKDSSITYPNGILITYMFGDFVYLFDAFLYYENCQRDKQDCDKNVEQERMVALNLAQHLTIENINFDVDNDYN